jgi:hypothetical protein
MLKALLVAILVLSMARCARIDPCSLPAGEMDNSLPQTFTSAEGRFKIGLPGTRANAESNDKSFKWTIINRGQFYVSYSDSETILEAPEVSETFINKLRDVARSKGDGEFEVDSEIRLAGHPGREFRIRRKHSLDIQRIYLVNKRMYMVTAFVPDEWNCKFDDVIKVLDSFELTEENARKRNLSPGD